MKNELLVLMVFIGKSVDWSNQMWFRADTLLLANELKGLGDVYPFVNKQVFEGNNTTRWRN